MNWKWWYLINLILIGPKNLHRRYLHHVNYSYNRNGSVPNKWHLLLLSISSNTRNGNSHCSCINTSTFPDGNDDRPLSTDHQTPIFESSFVSRKLITISTTILRRRFAIEPFCTASHIPNISPHRSRRQCNSASSLLSNMSRFPLLSDLHIQEIWFVLDLKGRSTLRRYSMKHYRLLFCFEM